jgi:hypothetical protein
VHPRLLAPFGAVFYRLNSSELALVILAVVGAGCAIGAISGRHIRRRSDTYHEPLGVLQGALLGVIGLVLAFGLSLAVGRYQDRRADVVAEANAIGTAYLRAQTIEEPQRTRSLAAFPGYVDLAIRVTKEVPGSDDLRATSADQGRLQRNLWRLAGESMNAHPTNSAQRLYLESLNEMFDDQSARLAGLNNRVPNAVLALELLGAALGVGVLALYLSALGKGLVPIVGAAIAVSALVYVTFDLDRPTRGAITVPATPLVAVRASMELPPAAPAPG